MAYIFLRDFPSFVLGTFGSESDTKSSEGMLRKETEDLNRLGTKRGVMWYDVMWCDVLWWGVMCCVVCSMILCKIVRCIVVYSAVL